MNEKSFLKLSLILPSDVCTIIVHINGLMVQEEQEDMVADNGLLPLCGIDQDEG